jgi:hypothetical protein
MMARLQPSHASFSALVLATATIGFFFTLSQVPLNSFDDYWMRELLLESNIAILVSRNNDVKNTHADHKSRDIKSKIKILFVMGIEGTGHQLFEELALVSPALQRMHDLQIHPQDIKNLSTLVGDGRASLWMAPCNAHGVQEDALSVPRIQKQLVDLLQSVEHKAQKENNDDSTTGTLTIPFNVIKATPTKLSYPNMAGPCRALQHPNLDVWYETCHLAGIQCEHVFIYRDPYEFLYSTVEKRNYNPSLLQAIHLYTTMLNTVYVQLLTHADRTAGCFGLMSPGMDQAWRKEIQAMLGWENDGTALHMNQHQNQTRTSSFDEVFESIYKLPQPLSEETKRSFIPPQFDSYMKSLLRANEAVKTLCHDTISKRITGYALLE